MGEDGQNHDTGFRVTAKRVIAFDPALPDGVVRNNAGFGIGPSEAWLAYETQPDEVILVKDGIVVARVYNVGETRPPDWWSYDRDERPQSLEVGK